ncbi:MAG: hypothetical protein AB9836_06010 [Aminipila sp.]
MKCNDCLKQSVCKYVEVMEKEEKALQIPSESNGIIKHALTCKEFYSKPMSRVMGISNAGKVGD